MISIIGMVLNLIMKYLPIFVKSAEDRAKAEKNIKLALLKYEKGVTSAAEIRSTEAEEDADLAAKWKAKWGVAPAPVVPAPVEPEPAPAVPKPAPTPAPVQYMLDLVAPDSVKVGAAFKVRVTPICPGALLHLGSRGFLPLGEAEEFDISLWFVGPQELKITQDGEVLGLTTVTVVS